MRFRQVHLDYHNSEFFTGIGEKFDHKQWQRILTEAAVDSITCFSMCGHGWSYHPTAIGQMHPNLKFDLLRKQIDACHEVDIKVPAYICVGINDQAANRHPEWREINVEGAYSGWVQSPLKPGFKKVCLNTPYLDYIGGYIHEFVTNYPDVDGIFLDITMQGECCCTKCLKDMLASGLNPEISSDRKLFADKVLDNYFKTVTTIIRNLNPDMRIVHNGGHISPRWTSRLQYFSHLELESLPTGLWGYDHFPMTSAFARQTGLEFLGMTGKFHTTWGEFGGYKHPNALKYECGAMLAMGAKCSIGDQLHPLGMLDNATYEIIGQAYREVKLKEQYCDNASPLADIAIIPQEAFSSCEGVADIKKSDVGASRILLEGHFLFDIIAPDMDFSRYKLLIFPDDLIIDDCCKQKIESFLSNGGKVIFSGKGGLNAKIDSGVEFCGENEFDPSYLAPVKDFAPDFCQAPFVMYGVSQNIKATQGKSLGKVFNPYFNISYLKYCSHQHAPMDPDSCTYDCGVIYGNIAYIAYNIFEIYRETASTALKHFVIKIINHLLGDNKTIICDLPSNGRITATYQENFKRTVVHLLFANQIKRGGGNPKYCWINPNIEVIEDLITLNNTHCRIKSDKEIKKVKLVPQQQTLDFVINDGYYEFIVPEFSGHQIILLEE